MLETISRVRAGQVDGKWGEEADERAHAAYYLVLTE